jgi:hypothetical protein
MVCFGSLNQYPGASGRGLVRIDVQGFSTSQLKILVNKILDVYK